VAVEFPAAGDLGSPENVQNADSEGTVDFAEAADRVVVVLVEKKLPVVLVDRTV